MAFSLMMQNDISRTDAPFMANKHVRDLQRLKQQGVSKFDILDNLPYHWPRYRACILAHWDKM